MSIINWWIFCERTSLHKLILILGTKQIYEAETLPAFAGQVTPHNPHTTANKSKPAAQFSVHQ
jgi:hypothetical protein